MGIKTGIKQKVITFIPPKSKKGRQHTQAGQRDVRTIQNPGKRTHLAIKFHFKIEIFARRACRDLISAPEHSRTRPQPVYPVLYGTRWTRPPSVPLTPTTTSSSVGRPSPPPPGTQPQLPLRLRPSFRPPRYTSRARRPGRRRSASRRTPTPRASVHRFFCSFSGPFCPTTPEYERCPSMSARQERVHHRQAVHDVHRLVRAFVGRYLLDNEAVLCA